MNVKFRDYSHRELMNIATRNGYVVKRITGDHFILSNLVGNIMVLTLNDTKYVRNRIIKRYNLEV